MFGFGLNWLLCWVNLELGTVVFLQGCRLSMMLIVALYLPWCWYLGAQDGVQPQLYADNFKSLGILVYFCVLHVLLLGMSGLLVRSLHLVNVFSRALLGLYVGICGVRLSLMRQIGGQSSWMFVI